MAGIRNNVCVKFINEDTDYPFVYNAFRINYKSITKEKFNIILNSGCFIVHAIDDPEQLYGFILFTKPLTINFIYVKKNFRGMGIARLLLEYLDYIPKYYTFSSNNHKFIRQLGLKYSPFTFINSISRSTDES